VPVKEHEQSRPTFRKPPPEGVIEITNITSAEGSALVEDEDGTLRLYQSDQYRTSTDGGGTWSGPQPLRCPEMGSPQGLGCLRLQSGTLAASYRRKTAEDRQPFHMAVSNDDGETWDGPYEMNLLGSPYYDTVIQLSSGRLLAPSRTCFSNLDHPGLCYEEASSWGRWKGLRLQVTGHYHYPEIDIAAVSYSDDGGQTWEQCEGKLMGWFDAEGIPNGRCGVTACDEPSVAETADGRVLFFARSTVGRIVQSYSSDGGQTWTAVRPTDLASSYSPPRLRRIPQTGDLMCVWNQVSREEIRRGYRRGRLSVAISKDSGGSWGNFKTLEVSEGIEDIARIAPEYPVTPVIGLPDVGELPNGFATFDYPNIGSAQDKVYIMYTRSWVAPAEEQEEPVTLGERMQTTAAKPAETVLRVYPLEWFYQ